MAGSLIQMIRPTNVCHNKMMISHTKQLHMSSCLNHLELNDKY